MKKICCQKETGHRYNAKTRAESARFVIAKWRARCPRYNIIRGSGSTEMIQCIHMHIFNQLKKIDRKVMVAGYFEIHLLLFMLLSIGDDRPAELKHNWNSRGSMQVLEHYLLDSALAVLAAWQWTYLYSN